MYENGKMRLFQEWEEREYRRIMEEVNSTTIYLL
jgi:hypothetical protein